MSIDHYPIINYPKPLPNETPKEYADRLGVSLNSLYVESDFTTQETRYKGYGWYDPHH